ncbi:MAG: glycerophosphodiester phosphodiesterase [Gemmatimonadetes bacterium]|nr:glycerophosphodiester phosphodiesterase [Gemmatimonadota bacterium]
MFRTVTVPAGLVLLVAAACGPAPAPPVPPPYTGNVTIIAHRGASGHEPEHTVAAYDRAIALGAHYIEQDLQRTSDRVLVVLHDETLDRTIRGPECRGPVSGVTWKALRRCDAGSWFGERYPDRARLNLRDLHPLALTELFTRYRDTVRYYIETKQPASAPGMERQLLEALAAANLGDAAAREWRVVIQSFSEGSLRLVRSMEPRWPLVQLLERQPAGRDVGALLDSIAQYADGVGPNRLDVDASFVAAAHERCLVVHPYTVDLEEEMRTLARAGVDGMFTDFPDRMRMVLGTLGPTRAAFPARCPRRPV